MKQKFNVTTFMIITLIILVFVVDFSQTDINNKSDVYFKSNSNNYLEKNIEDNYIYKDALLTANFQLKQLVSQLQVKLNNLNNRENLDKLIEKNPKIIEISYIKKNTLSIKDSKAITYLYPLISTIMKDDKGYFVIVTIPVITKHQLVYYKIKIKMDVIAELEKKQQLRMYTVTNLQNNKWKTTPTKYSPRKKLGLSLNDQIKNLKPRPEDKGISHYINNEVVIKFKKSASERYIRNLLSNYDLKIKKRRDHTIIAYSTSKSTKTIIKLLEDNYNSLIEYVEPHFIYLTNEINDNTNLIPNDNLYLDYQWNLPLIYTELGWKKTRGAEDVIIAVIDTGVDLNHPEFSGRLIDGYNVIEPSLPPMDDDGHGTHVAGIISANTNNNQGIAGITWFNKIMPIKVLDQSGAGTLFDVAEGIIWATDHGAKVINLSLGNYAESKYLHDAIKYAYSKDVVIVAATGNDNTDELGFPAAYPEVIAVSAIDSNRDRAEFSNYGSYIDVVAPGVNIPSTYPDEQYAALSGTSMASPHVAGLAGLIRSINPELTNNEVVEIIKKTATDLGMPGKDPYYGYGQINILEAINYSELFSKNNEIEKDGFISWLKEILKKYFSSNQ
ncbi:hypothetical protein BHF71_09335 [Vulcanibacillus modesticaldus]|uniref:Uncharacterized protein n=1 Tax=Vulcanibacillus modesticaldus TaxID=337097 RepID=A0A1D2YUD6_9BACI|nr:S8 family peptidase [Vulcanibacillus modesticaldus]OEF99271.1 hypothetical protein BHF71_09335 [Vulcanibacillus modesticaldus]